MDDIRWQQRFSNFNNAFRNLEMAVKLSEQRTLSLLEKQGLIQFFEFTHELAWNVMKDYLSFQGIADIIGSRGAIRAAFKQGLIVNGEAWMDTIKRRNETTHTYNEELANEISEKILNIYYLIFKDFKIKMESLKNAG